MGGGGEKRKARVEKACGRLLSHTSLETAPRVDGKLEVEPRLVQRLLSQYDGGMYGLARYALADRALLGAVTRDDTACSAWRKNILKGSTSASLLASRAALASIGTTPAPLESFSPAAGLVDDAVAAAARATTAYNKLKEKMRAVTLAVRAAEKAEQAQAEKANAARKFPTEWENLGPRPGTDTGESFGDKPASASATAQRAVHVRDADADDETKEVEKDKSTTSKPNPNVSDRSLRLSTRNAKARCCFCPEHLESDSELLGPFVNSRGRATLYVHFDCACWAPQVFADPKTAIFRGVYDEYRRGRQLRCSGCRQKGATVGCYIEKCKRVFHYRCLEKCGARKVSEYFAAFCRHHAHLADKDTYQQLMRAHTIADVAAARRESTDGLDAPHSRYTNLRRRDTEVIFSRSTGKCCHSGAHEHAMSVFSMTKRKVISSGEPFSVHNHVRLIRHSAIAVASGYFAHKAASRHSGPGTRRAVPLFLLRNLRGAPQWTADEIQVDKAARKRSVHFNVRMRKHTRRATNGGVGVVGTLSESPKKRVASESESEPSAKLARTRGTSARLPQPCNHRLRGTRRLVSVRPVTVASDLERPTCSPPPAVLERTHRAPDGSTTRTARKCGWDEFLAEQLPRERALRPDDDVERAMANMARLWSLMPRAERARYEARAVAGSDPGKPAPEPKQTWRGAAGSAGLFSVRPASVSEPKEPVSNGKTGGGSGARTSASGKRGDREHASFTLSSQRGRLRGRLESGNTGGCGAGNDVDWDEMFPLDLPTSTGMGGGKGGAGAGSSHVRPPPAPSR